MKKTLVLVTLATLGFGAAAQAGVSMSFADPIPGRQLHHKANGVSPGLGSLTFDMTAQLSFLFDGTSEGLPNHVFTNAFMELNMSLGASTVYGDIITAPVEGYFRIYDASGGAPVEILTGTAAAGTFVRVSNTNSILFSDPNFFYTPGAALLAVTGPMSFGGPSEAVFTLTNFFVHNGAPFINPDGSFNSFDADSSYSGHTNLTLIPTPAGLPLAMGGIGGLCAFARRRRAYSAR